MPLRNSLAGRAWRLDAGQRPLALEAGVALTLACVAMRLLPGRWIQHMLRRVPRERRRTAAVPAEAVVRMVDRVAAAHPFRPRCLESALAGRWMLARRGHASTLVIGARRPIFEAHAWLEVEGQVTPATPQVARYEPIWRS